MPAAPTLIAGRYRLGGSLGRGGMGQVWLARDETLDRDVAVKEIDLPADLRAEDREGIQRRTLREARAAARLNHAHVVQVYDVLEADGRTWIVMEYVPSRSLQEVLTADGPLDDDEAARIGLDVLAALEAAHRAGVWHRDVKPANVLLGVEGRVVLTDFGIATIEGDALVTGSGLVIGSPEYMPPERARHGTTGPAADLWSLGATLYAAVEGRSPYRRGSVLGTLTALVSDEPDPPQRAGALRPVLDGLLQTDPAHRTDIAETRRRLLTAAGDTGAPTPPTAGPPHLGTPVPDQRRPEPAQPATAAPSTDVAATSAQPATAIPVDPTMAAPAPPAPARAAVGRRRPLVAVLAVLLALAVAGAGWYGLRPDRSTPTRDPAAQTAGGAPASASAPVPRTAPTAAVAPPGSPGASPSSGAPAGSSPATPSAGPSGQGNGGGTAARPALPSGWRLHRDTTGFSVYVPSGWRQSREGTMVYFRAPRGGRVLGIDQTDRPRADPVADWRRQAAFRVDRGDFPGYDEIRIAGVRYWQKAADWEFTFDGGNRRHVNNRGFVVSADQAYAIYWQTSDADWDDAGDDLQLVYDSFRPAGD